MEGLAIEIDLGGKAIPGRLPLMMLRFALWNAWGKALAKCRVAVEPVAPEPSKVTAAVPEGFTDEEVADPDNVIAPPPAPEVEYTLDTSLMDADEVLEISIAALGMCWAGDALLIEAYPAGKEAEGLRTYRLPGQADRLLRALGRDVRSFGSHVEDALLMAGVSHRDMYRAGKKCREAVTAAVPKESEVAESAKDFIDPAAPSTGPTH